LANHLVFIDGGANFFVRTKFDMSIN
jgi:hypothetical protein